MKQTIEIEVPDGKKAVWKNRTIRFVGYFYSDDGVSSSAAYVGLRSVSTKEIAQHISTYFGKLLFDIQYGGTNCDWEWVE